MTTAICKLGPDAYCEWSEIVDAPVTGILTHTQAHARYPEDRMRRVEENGTSYHDLSPQTPEDIVSGNRAGPNEECLTLAAILRRYSPGADDSEPLTPGELAVWWTNGFTDDGEAEDGNGPIYVWKPWRPDGVPAELTPGMDLHPWSTAGVRIGPEEHAKLVAEARERRAAKLRPVRDVTTTTTCGPCEEAS